MITARTRVAGVIGDPVRHSLSPVLHNAAYQALGLDWVYVAFAVPPGGAPAAVEAVRGMGLAGLSVTMPHKVAAASAVDRLTPTARRLGSINTVIPHRGELVGDSTDGPGLLDALRSGARWDPHGQVCVVLGTGGAARAVTLALAEAGAARVVVVGRRPEAAAECAALAGPAGTAGSAEEVAGAGLVVNGTPVGLSGTGSAGLPLGLDAARLGKGQLVVDMNYAPPITPVMEAASARGAIALNGLGMLVGQAARQIAAWSGQDPPRDVMTEAGRRALEAVH